MSIFNCSLDLAASGGAGYQPAAAHPVPVHPVSLQAVPAHPVPAQAARDSTLLHYLNPAPRFELLGVDDSGRAEAEAFVRERYRTAFQAQVTHFMPWLLTLRCLGGLSGVAGFRPADSAPLFLEQYLQQPLESLLAAQSNSCVERTSIVEIGNLATSQLGASHLMFLLFSALLHHAGHEWITFTATKALRNNLEKLGFPLLTLAEAEAGKLGAAERAAWGSYYATTPLVMAGKLSTAMELIESRPLLRRVLRLYQHDIAALAAQAGVR